MRPFEIDPTTFDRWKQLLETSINEQASWQSYIAQAQQEITLHPFDTIEEICRGNACIYMHYIYRREHV